MPRKRTSEKELIVSATAAAPRRQSNVKPRAKRTAKEVEAVEVVPVELAAGEPVALGPSAEEIAQLAFTYWEARGCQGGSPEEDWLRAEAALRTRAASATA